jgi:hypothetical protein
MQGNSTAPGRERNRETHATVGPIRIRRTAPKDGRRQATFDASRCRSTANRLPGRPTTSCGSRGISSAATVFALDSLANGSRMTTPPP